MRMHTIAYISSYTGRRETLVEDLTDICEKSKSNNPKNNITGVMFYHNRRFMQLIEGDKKDLDRLMAKLHKDPRHCQIMKIVDTPVSERGFASWNMDTFNLDIDQQISVSLVQKCTDLFDSNPVMNAGHFVTAVKSILHYGQLRKLMVM